MKQCHKGRRGALGVEECLTAGARLGQCQDMSAAEYNLAGKYRPKTFGEVAGQEGAVKVLSALALSGAPVQQILLAGPSGAGKTTLARIFAAELMCTSGAGICGKCESCMAFQKGSHPDVVEIDAASYGGVDQVRELAGSATHAAMLSEWRVYILDEAHGLTHGGGQAFLKLLEEPPEKVIFILATTDPQKLPIAVRGRCLQLEVTTPQVGELVSNILRVCKAEGWNVSKETAGAVVAASDSELGVRGTLMTLSKVSSWLASGDEKTARKLLGSAESGLLQDVVEDVLQGRVNEVLEKTGKLLAGTSPGVVKTQMSNLLVKSLYSGSPRNDKELLGEIRLLKEISEADPTTRSIALALAVTAVETQQEAGEGRVVLGKGEDAKAGETPLLGKGAEEPKSEGTPEEKPPSAEQAAGNAEGGAKKPSVPESEDVPASEPERKPAAVARRAVSEASLLNAVSAKGVKAALALRKGSIKISDDTYEISAQSNEELATAIAELVAEGWPITITWR